MNMPKHMTGDDFIQLMERKRQEKDDMEEAKKRRKLEREVQKIEQDKKKQEKERARQNKKLLAAEKKAKVLASREARKAAKNKAPVFKPPS